MINRLIEPVFLNRLAHYPSVVLVGARQSGKTTLAKRLSANYYDLETEAGRLRLDLEWERVCSSMTPIVLDEVQSFPEIFPKLRAAIDSDRRRNGRFILLGSVAPTLMHQVSESLAGRVAMLELYPLSLLEVGKTKLEELWRYGGFPDGGILQAGAFPTWQQSYLTLLTQRDLPNLGLPSKPVTTLRLLKMLAALQGQLWNASKLGAALGLNYQTVASYMEYLDGTFLTRSVAPFETNLRKRLVKSPKVYIRDTGLMHSLLDLQVEADLRDQHWVGFSWEGFVIEQILSALNSMGESVSPYFLRTSNGEEIDLIFSLKGSLVAVEIKLTTEPDRSMLKTLKTLGDQIGADRKVLIHFGSDTGLGNSDLEVTSLFGFLESISVGSK